MTIKMKWSNSRFRMIFEINICNCKLDKNVLFLRFNILMNIWPCEAFEGHKYCCRGKKVKISYLGLPKKERKSATWFSLPIHNGIKYFLEKHSFFGWTWVHLRMSWQQIRLKPRQFKFKRCFWDQLRSVFLTKIYIPLAVHQCAPKVRSH